MRSAFWGPHLGPKGAMNEYREVYRPRPRFYAIGAVPRLARGPSAIYPRACSEGPAGRPRRVGGGPDRPCRRQFTAGLEERRRGARQAAEGFRLGFGPSLSRAGDRAAV